jgi:hypothetical protein
MRRIGALLLVALAGCGGSAAEGPRAAAPTATPTPFEPVATAPCGPPVVHPRGYPGGDESLKGLPWVRAEPRSLDVVGLLWYWPENWANVRRARVFTGGVHPAGYSAKVLWAFLAPSARNRGGEKLVITGRNLDTGEKVRDSFHAIGYSGQNGAPSYATGLDVPTPGCWRLTLTTGDLKAVVDFRAVDLSKPAAGRRSCNPPLIHRGDDGGDPRLEGVWIEAEPSELQLVAALGYWPEDWDDVRRAQVYTGGVRDGTAAKTAWIFLAPELRGDGGSRLKIRGRNLEGEGTWEDSFAEIFYEGQKGAPSYASILDLPEPGCWRLTLTTGDLRASVDIRAVAP